MTAKAKENGMSRDATIWQSPEVPECVSTIPEGIILMPPINWR